MNKRIILVVAGIAIVAELVWAFSTLGIKLQGTTDQTPVPTISKTAPAPVVEKASISLTSSKGSFRVGEEIAVSVNISSSVPTDGADVILKFDNKILSPLAIETSSLYEDYPQDMADGKKGLIAISGVTSAQGGVPTNGPIASVFFKAVKPGRTTVSVDFTPDSTIDSNIVGTSLGKDLLSEVKDLTLEIVP